MAVLPRSPARNLPQLRAPLAGFHPRRPRGFPNGLAALAALLLAALAPGQAGFAAAAESAGESDAPAPVAGVPPPERRPADWPVLPREGGVDGYDDPLEGVNRVFFYANGALDYVFFDPLARVYRFATPAPARRAVGRAFTNLAEPVVAVNHLLQGDFTRSARSVGRFLVNGVAGVAGLFDVATGLGLAADDADFGQTLHRYGMGDGFYLVLPVFGPSTARDALGFGVDGLLDPRTHLLADVPRLSLALGEGVVRREEVIDPVDFLVEHAADHYEAVRAWTYQRRQREIADGCARAAGEAVCPGYEGR